MRAAGVLCTTDALPTYRHTDAKRDSNVAVTHRHSCAICPISNMQQHRAAPAKRNRTRPQHAQHCRPIHRERSCTRRRSRRAGLNCMWASRRSRRTARTAPRRGGAWSRSAVTAVPSAGTSRLIVSLHLAHPANCPPRERRCWQSDVKTRWRGAGGELCAVPDRDCWYPSSRAVPCLGLALGSAGNLEVSTSESARMPCWADCCALQRPVGRRCFHSPPMLQSGSQSLMCSCVDHTAGMTRALLTPGGMEQGSVTIIINRPLRTGGR